MTSRKKSSRAKPRRKIRKKTPSPRKKIKKPFGEAELIKEVWAAMETQARENPLIALLHERLEGKIKLIGLTGGIASGKSLIAGFFRDHKIPVIDADEIAREVVQPKKPAYRQIILSFGEGILKPDGTIDRERLGGIVFTDERKRRLLESITHPEISKEILKRVKDLKKKAAPLVVIDAALLFESGLDQPMHKNILVRIDPEVQLRRLTERDRIPEAQAWPRILAQMPTPEKQKLADFVIDNSGSPEETRSQVAALLARLFRTPEQDAH